MCWQNVHFLLCFSHQSNIPNSVKRLYYHVSSWSKHFLLLVLSGKKKSNFSNKLFFFRHRFPFLSFPCFFGTKIEKFPLPEKDGVIPRSLFCFSLLTDGSRCNQTIVLMFDCVFCLFFLLATFSGRKLLCTQQTLHCQTILLSATIAHFKAPSLEEWHIQFACHHTDFEQTIKLDV